MSDYQTIEAGSTVPRVFAVISKFSGFAIQTGTVNYHLKQLIGTNAGKWWRAADNTWQAAETANAMTFEGGDADWSLALAQSPFAAGGVYLEYVKESAGANVANSRTLKCEYTPQATAARKAVATLAPADVSGNLPVQVNAYATGQKPLNFELLAITAQGEVTLTPAYDAAKTAAAPDDILLTPGQPLATDALGQVTAGNAVGGQSDNINVQITETGVLG